MKRIIKDYKTIGDELLQLLIQRYPDGIYEDDLIVFTTPKGVNIKAVELKTEEVVYLVKMSSELQAQMSSFSEDEGMDPYSDGYRESLD